ncbi:hypothetical protein GY12_03070 [Micrococcus luteus]|nr:hypothetical protein GY12_03070 [Micrococcus luteus]
MSSVLPSLLSGRRRILLASLAGLGLVQAAISVLVAVLTPRLLAAGSGGLGSGGEPARGGPAGRGRPDR